MLFMVKLSCKWASLFSITTCSIYAAFSCNGAVQPKQSQREKNTVQSPGTATSSQNIYNNQYKVIHVFVALCDNLHQGIEPVPKGIGNGRDPATNLYWGCDYGVKAFFKNKTSWKLVSVVKNPARHVLDGAYLKSKPLMPIWLLMRLTGSILKIQCRLL